MQSKSIEIIKIHYDRSFNFYVEKVRVGKKPLPAFISMSSSEKEKLADAYPDKGYIIMSTQAGTRTAKEIIEPLIEEYNSDCLNGNITRWYKISKDYKFIPIDTSSIPSCGLQHPEYNGVNDRDEIIAFIKELEKDLKKEHYGVFICPKCEEVQYQLIVKNRVTCWNEHCGEQFNSEICIAKFTSDNNASNRTLAVARYLQEKNIKRTPTPGPLVGLWPLTYKGVVYRCSLPECKLLHKVLYNDFACEVVFEVKDDGTIDFTENYLRYLKSLSDNNIRKDLYKAVGRIQKEINSQVNSIKSVEKAFYWYINNYDLNEENALVLKVDDRIYKFTTLDEFVRAFINGSNDEKLRLKCLFNDLTSQENNLFYGYNSNDASELSRLIYEATKQFIFISDSGIVEFGDDFIEQLHLQDKLINTRNLFLESIRQNYKFWDQIKNSFDISDTYFRGSDESYYDRLCFYQFAITGKKVLRYKTLSIQNSQSGFGQIKSIIRDAYSINDDQSMKQFNALVELAKNQALCERLDKISPVTETITFSAERSQESITFDSLRSKLKGSPSLELYLMCSDLTGDGHKKIKIRFDNSMKTFSSHLRNILENESGKSLIDAIKRFYNDSDIKFFINYVLNRKSSGGSDRFNQEHNEGFNKLIASIAELENRYSKMRTETMNSEMRGRNISRRDETPVVQHRVEPSTPTSAQPKRNVEQPRRAPTPQPKPKTNQGDNDDEWS